MQSKSKSKSNFLTQKQQARLLFSSLIGISFILWVLYRYLFSFSEIFDETVGKAVFFGMPVLIYASAINTDVVSNSLDPKRATRGLLRGLAYGGIIGFVGIVALALNRKNFFIAAPVFLADAFWRELLLASFTAFWESIFFFGFIQAVLLSHWRHRGKIKIWLVSSLVFLLFHLPNLMLRFFGVDAIFLVLIMFLFGLGQAILFDQEESVYPLIITHTIWGMILLIHF